MKIKTAVLVALFSLMAFAAPLSAQDIVSTVEKGCTAEIEQFCSKVTLGEGRLLACFYAHEDKLSGQCQYALYTASAQLEHAVSALNYVAGQCSNDIQGLCASVQAGEGRILECLESQSESVSAACKQALNDVFE
ncbi:MAG: cysteine rich repeat-containing protein [Gammaproteobacteria bacterium]|nr:cysteine rich repeat-containing protein [Gammaproteobacteria bacterium]